MSVKRYRKKPVVIDAMQFDGGNYPEIVSWIDETRDRVTHAYGQGADLYIETLEGTMHVSKGDFVIKGVQGEFYPCKPDIFEATYEEAELPPAAAKVFIRPAKLSGWKWECVCWTSGVERTWRGALRCANNHLKGHAS